jgi:hypothetical protein
MDSDFSMPQGRLLLKETLRKLDCEFFCKKKRKEKSSFSGLGQASSSGSGKQQWLGMEMQVTKN